MIYTNQLQYRSLSCTEPRKGHFISDIYQKRNWNKKIRTEIKTTNISFKRLIISLFKQYNKSLNRYKIEWKLKQEKKNRMDINSRKTDKKLEQQIYRLNDFSFFFSNIYRINKTFMSFI